MSITIANITFDNVDYGEGGDALSLHRCDPSKAVGFDESPEGHALRFDATGQLVGITLLRPRWHLKHDGKIGITLPPQHVDLDPTQLDDALAAAQRIEPLRPRTAGHPSVNAAVTSRCSDRRLSRFGDATLRSVDQQSATHRAALD